MALAARIVCDKRLCNVWVSVRLYVSSIDSRYLRARRTGYLSISAAGARAQQQMRVASCCEPRAEAQHKKGKGSPYSITERRVPELIPVLDSQPAGDVSHKPDGRLPLLSARPAVTPATLKRAATSFAAW